jgi:hypothetical protein
MIKNIGLNGSQFLAKERMSKARKLRGGPGMTGRIQPTRPASATNNPKINSTVVKVSFLLNWWSDSLFLSYLSGR